MGVFPIALMLAMFLCSLVASFLFAFAIVAMPGIGRLGDREFLRAFQVMDLVIQKNQPVFVLVWVGSVASLLAAAALGIGRLDGPGRLLLMLALLAYLLGLQLPTVIVHLPLNRRFRLWRWIPWMNPAEEPPGAPSNRAGTDGTPSGWPLRAWYRPC